MHRGYTKAWRKELESEIWSMPPLYHRVWFWIRQKVQYEPYLYPTKGKYGIWVAVGQKLCSYQQIAENVKWEEWGVEKVPNRKTIKDILDWLEFRGMIKTESNTKGTLIIVTNWDIYNACTTEESEVKVTRHGHKEEYKRIKNKNIYVDKGVFEPPSLNEVAEYCLKRNNGVDPEKWHNFYQSKGWMVGKNKMKDWKAAVRTWEQKKVTIESDTEYIR